MDELKYLLSFLNEKSPEDEIKSTFERIAFILLFRSHIKSNDGNYRMLEIEFYFKNGNHEDEVTIGRDEQPGMWWLHDWGVDITFKSDDKEKKYGGGILIRSIVSLDEDADTVVCGPQKCAWELFYASALTSDMSPCIEMNNGGEVFSGKMGKTKRFISGKTKKVDGDYRFYVEGLENLKIEKNYKASPWKKMSSKCD